MATPKLINPMTRQGVKKIRVTAYCRVSSSAADQLNSYTRQIDVYNIVFFRDFRNLLAKISKKYCKITLQFSKKFYFVRFFGRRPKWFGLSKRKASRKTCFSFWLLSKPTGLVYHHASVCISCRLDDIRCFALVIYKDSVFDDIHGYRRAKDVKGTNPISQPIRISFLCIVNYFAQYSPPPCNSLGFLL